MKRDIKFRGKRVESGEWIVGWLFQDDDDHFPMIHQGGTLDDWEQVEEDSVGQFTGLTDKKGIDIYEGDIVEMDSWSPSKAVVCFDDGAFCLMQEGVGYMNDIHYVHHAGRPQATVVGNIYDNKELIE